MDDYTEETYFYQSIQDAVEEMERMKAERPCEMIFDVEDLHNGQCMMTVKVGEAW